MTIRTSQGEGRMTAFALGAALFFVASLVYWNTLGGEFIKDDIYQVLGNEWIKDFSNVGKVFTSSAWGFMTDGGEQGYYRPWMHVFYMVSYSLSELQPWGYHIINIILHALNTVLLFILALALFKDEGVLEVEGLAKPAAFFAALLFATHPINTEAVAWVAAVPELSFTFFTFLALILYQRGSFFLSAAFFFVAAFAKETALALPFILLALDLSLRRTRISPLSEWVKRYWPYMLGVVVYFAFRFSAVGGAEVGVEGENLSGMGMAVNLPPLIFEYFKKLFIPIDLVYFHHIRFDIIGSLFEVRGLLYFALAVVFFLFTLWTFRAIPFVFFSIIWIVAPLLPILALSVITGIPTFSERYLYLSSAGFSMLIVFVLFKVASAKAKDEARNKTVLVISALVVVLAIVYSVATFERNRVWHTSIGLWADVVEKAPQNMTARLWYGKDLARAGRLEEAANAYREAIRVSSTEDLMDGIHNNLGVVYAKLGKIEAAALEFKTALVIDSQNEEARKNLEAALAMLRSFDGGGG